MYTYKDLHAWVLKNEGAKAAKVIASLWMESKSRKYSSLSNLLISGFSWVTSTDQVFTASYWNNLHEKLLNDGL